MFEFIWICEWRNTDIRLVSFFVWALDSGAEVSSKNRQDRAGVVAVIQKKKALKLLQRLLYSRLNTQTVCRFIEQNPVWSTGSILLMCT